MIPSNAITAWAVNHPWPTRTQIEQDLLLSRVLIAIASHPYLGSELAFRGGTALPHIHVRHTVNSEWWAGTTDVVTFQPPELLATKIRALYQRSKGRDLFDLWLALTELGVDPDEILTSFVPHRPDGLTAALSVANLHKKLKEPRFRDDPMPLVTSVPAEYGLEAAAELVIDKLLSRIR